MRYMFELSGEHPDLPVWEAEALLSCSGKTGVTDRDALLAIISSKADADEFKGRIALSHFLSEHIESMEIDELDGFFERLDYSNMKTASVRVKTSEAMKKRLDAAELGRRLGGIVSDSVKIDLSNPGTAFRIFIGDRAHVGREISPIDRSQYEKRKNRFLPFVSPVSIHPRLARAMINLSAKKTGARILDPFCGTGTFLIEGAMMGMQMHGSDLSSKMIEGSGRNLEHFGLSADLLVLDVADIKKFKRKFDCIVTDPPYGRSSSTNKEPIDDLYARALESFSKNLVDRGRVGIVLPDEKTVPMDGFAVIRRASIRVHRSLVRNFLILEKE